MIVQDFQNKDTINENFQRNDTHKMFRTTKSGGKRRKHPDKRGSLKVAKEKITREMRKVEGSRSFGSQVSKNQEKNNFPGSS